MAWLSVSPGSFNYEHFWDENAFWLTYENIFLLWWKMKSTLFGWLWQCVFAPSGLSYEITFWLTRSFFHLRMWRWQLTVALSSKRMKEKKSLREWYILWNVNGIGGVLWRNCFVHFSQRMTRTWQFAMLAIALWLNNLFNLSPFRQN